MISSSFLGGIFSPPQGQDHLHGQGHVIKNIFFRVYPLLIAAEPKLVTVGGSNLHAH